MNSSKNNIINKNKKTGAILALVAILFFCLVFVKKIFF